jgi:uncharacterized protein (DUF433 family)
MIQVIEAIATDPNIRGGRPHILGTGIEVRVVVIDYITHQRLIADIASDYGLSLAQVHAALAYYYEHQAQMDDIIASQEAIGAYYKEQRIGSRHPPLFG